MKAHACLHFSFSHRLLAARHHFLRGRCSGVSRLALHHCTVLLHAIMRPWPTRPPAPLPIRLHARPRPRRRSPSPAPRVIATCGLQTQSASHTSGLERGGSLLASITLLRKKVGGTTLPDVQPTSLTFYSPLPPGTLEKPKSKVCCAWWALR